MENRYKIIYDIKQRNVVNVRFKQGDVDSSVLEVTIVDGGLPVDITGEVIEYRFLKPDNTVVYQDSTNGVTVLDAAKGKTECVLKSNTLARAGQVKCEVHREKDGQELTTPAFTFTVESSIGDDGIPSTNYISIIEQIKAAYEEATHENTVLELTDARHDNVNNVDYDNIGDRMDTIATEINTISSNIIEVRSDVLALETVIGDTTSELTEDQTATVPLVHGTQTITAPRTSPAKVKIPGRTLVNLLGRDGNCEDVSKWNTYNCVLALDSVNKVFGNYGIKITLSGIDGSLNNLISKYITDMTKHYLFTASIKNGNATEIKIGKDNSGGGNTVLSNAVTNTSAFTRVGVKFSPQDLAAGDFLIVNVTGGNTEYAYVDGIASYKLSDADSNLTVEQLLEKYPYVDSVQHLTGAYVANETNGSHLYVMDSLGEGETFENGQKNKVWERKVLDGSLNWTFSSSLGGYKQVQLPDGAIISPDIRAVPIATKYDGKILKPWTPDAPLIDQCWYSSLGALYLTIPNADSGWGPNYNPTSDEIKAYFMGWRMGNDVDGQPYNGINNKIWGKVTYHVVSWGIDGTLTLPTTVNQNSVKDDWTPYELHYKLATPVSNTPVETEGSLMLSAGANQFALGEGVVVREVVTPKEGTGSTSKNILYINVKGNASIPDCQLQLRLSRFLDIYKNDKVDSSWTTRASAYSYGDFIAETAKENFDPSATYTVTYLAEQYQTSASALSAELTYAENLGTVVQDTAEKMSDVETDLSGYKVFQQQELTIVKSVISGKNLLHNWDFRNPVNQRGQSSYTSAGYSIDRWKLGAYSKLSIGNGYITLSANGGSAEFLQWLELPYAVFAGKTVTLSVLLGDGTLLSASATTPTAVPSVWTNIINIITSWGFIQYNYDATVGRLFASIITTSGKTTNVRAIKLELGTVSTLANDPPADYGEQLALCQRYAIELNPYLVEYNHIGKGLGISTTNAYITVPIPTTLRLDYPTVAGYTSGDWFLFDGTNYIAVTGISTVACNSGSLIIVTTATGLTAGKSYVLAVTTPAKRLFISADL